MSLPAIMRESLIELGEPVGDGGHHKLAVVISTQALRDVKHWNASRKWSNVLRILKFV